MKYGMLQKFLVELIPAEYLIELKIQESQSPHFITLTVSNKSAFDACRGVTQKFQMAGVINNFYQAQHVYEVTFTRLKTFQEYILQVGKADNKKALFLKLFVANTKHELFDFLRQTQLNRDLPTHVFCWLDKIHFSQKISAAKTFTDVVKLNKVIAFLASEIKQDAYDEKRILAGLSRFYVGPPLLSPDQIVCIRVYASELNQNLSCCCRLFQPSRVRKVQILQELADNLERPALGFTSNDYVVAARNKLGPQPRGFKSKTLQIIENIHNLTESVVDDSRPLLMQMC